MKRKSMVHLLPTDKVSPIGVVKETNHAYYYKHGAVFQEMRHLYLSTDEEIKEGEWVINLNDDRLYQLKQIVDRKAVKLSFRKIVATTNPELWGEKNQCDGCRAGLPLKDGIHGDTQLFGIACTADRYKSGLASIPEDFIKAYVKAYNEAKPIDWVMLEVDVEFKGGYPETKEEKEWFANEYPLKLRSNGTCIIHPVEERKYTREEFRAAVRQAWIYSCGMVKFDDWFDKNYPENS